MSEWAQLDCYAVGGALARFSDSRAVGFSVFSLSVIGRSRSLACLWVRLCGPCLPCASGRALREQ